MHESAPGIIGLDESVDNTAIAFESDLRALVIVAHPDDETLWAGGLMLMCPSWRWTVLSLCRGSDRDRRRKFFKAMTHLDAAGRIGDLDDGPEQTPLSEALVASAISSDLPDNGFDLVLTHSPFGEYTRHLRHEEVARAVLSLWGMRAIRTKELWLFAYSDHERKRLPEAIDDAHLKVSLPDAIWRQKRGIIGDIYGFAPDSWEYRTTPMQEAFWRFRAPADACHWQSRRETRIGIDQAGTAEKGAGSPHRSSAGVAV
jgi:LmbE family N-acetylglucosaminyl deacetylase